VKRSFLLWLVSIALPLTPAHARSQAVIDGQGRPYVFGLSGGPTGQVPTYSYFSNGTWNLRALPPGALIRAPVAAVNNSGQIYVVGVGTDQGIYWTRGSGDTFEGWHPLNGYAGLFPGEESSPSIGVNADGRVEVFVYGTDRRTYHNAEISPGSGTWSGFSPLTDQAYDPVAVARNADGRLEIFATTHDNEIDHMSQLSPGGSWSAWGPLPAPSGKWIEYVTTIRATNDADGRIVVYMTGNRSDGQLQGPFTQWQIPAYLGGGWAPLAAFGLDSSNRPASPNAIAVVRDNSGCENVFANQATGPGAGIYVRRQIAPNGTWESVWTYTNSGPIVQTDALSLSDGRICVFSWDKNQEHMKVGCGYPAVPSSWTAGSWLTLW
jgi:hypothetical protein